MPGALFIMFTVLNRVICYSSGIEIAHSTPKYSFLRQITVGILVICILVVWYCLSY